MSHFHLPPEAWTADAKMLVLTGDEARHAAKVRRHRVGDVLSVLDGAGRRAVGGISVLEDDRVVIEVTEIHHTPLPGVPLTLVQAIPKGDTIEWIIEKAVELGVAEIQPVITERTIIRLDEKDALKKHQKWSRQLIEACKQCGQTHFPRLHPVAPLKNVLPTLTDLPLRIVASLEPRAQLLSGVLTEVAPSAAGLAIGPEGDFSPAEYDAFAEAGWKPWTLGHLTLRCETAAISAVAILRHQFSCPS